MDLLRALRDMLNPSSACEEIERQYLKSLAGRESLSSEQFHERYYSDSTVSVFLVGAVRSELQAILGYNIDALHRADNIAENFPGLDFADVLYRMERRFRVRLPCKTLPREVDGTFHTLVLAIHRRQGTNN